MALSLATVVTGLYYKHYFAVFVFSTWATIEILLVGLKGKKLFELSPAGRGIYSFASLLHLYGKQDTVSERVLEEKLLKLRESNSVDEKEYRWLWRLRDLLELKAILSPSYPLHKAGIKEGFAFSAEIRPIHRWDNPETFGTDEALKDIASTATHVSSLYWRAVDTALGDYGQLTTEARKLLSEIFGKPFDPNVTRESVRRLTDSMQRYGGVPFLVLNLIRRQSPETARQIAQSILLEESEFEQDLRSSVYWIAELAHFVQSAETTALDFDSTIRHLYHICFTLPDRAGFLEIDSKYFSQFEMISELAREGFLFKESLIESLLHMWREIEPFFDGVFQKLLEQMTARKSKIYDDREAWDMIWRQEKDGFNREYLYVVEGNVLYAAKAFNDAARFYEKALELNPTLRSALLNSLFVCAQLGDREGHAAMVKRVRANRGLMPQALSTIGNSFVVLGDLDAADEAYEELSEHRGWERKAAYYRSMFYYDQGMSEKALESAIIAAEENPMDTSIRFHLSLCYSAAGKKEEALEVVENLNEEPEWIRFYRFTLQRDTGMNEAASETLMNISAEYFDDPEELEQALDFAKEQRDLSLLRHLKAKAQ